MLFRFLAGASLVASTAAAQGLDARAQAERDLLKRAIEIPTVQFRN